MNQSNYPPQDYSGASQGGHFPPPPPNSGTAQNQTLSMADNYQSQTTAPQQQVSYPQQTTCGAPPQPTVPAEQVPYSTQDTHGAPPQPPRPFQAGTMVPAPEQPPVQPPRPQQNSLSATGGFPQYDPQDYEGTSQQGSYNPPPPPKRLSQSYGTDDPSNPTHYTRDPHKLIAYLVPFPKPRMAGIDTAQLPDRFLIYTPPPPPLAKPAEGEKEGKLHKVQRRWQEEVRSAKTSTAKTASWKGVKSKVTKGVSKAMSYTTTSNLDFLGRVSDNKSDTEGDAHAKDDIHEGDTTHKTVGVEEMVLIYDPGMGIPQDQMRAEFVNTMLRTKTKAQRDAIISTGLLPVAYGIDILATLVWPFGGLGEIDTVWAYSNIRGAKTARSVTKRLGSGSTTGDYEKDTLHLNFEPSQRVEVLRRYLTADCHKTDSTLFPDYVSAPTETDVLEAIGWNPHQSGGESKNWEDEQWEMQEVKDDLKLVMHKGAKEWRKWCKAYEKDPEKAMKK